MEPVKQIGFWDKLSYIFFPKERNGTTWIERWHAVTVYRTDQVHEARADNPDEKRLLDSMRTLSQKMGVEVPKKLLICDTPIPNGSMFGGGTMMLSTGLTQIMTPPQVDAVIGHELSHHKHRGKDAGVLMGLGLPTFIATWLGMNKYVHPKTNLSKWPRRAVNLAVSSEVEGLVTLPYRRTMEYRSDKEGAELTSPEDMAGGLKALDEWSQRFRIDQYKRRHGSNADPEDASWIEKAWNGLRRAKDPHPSMKNRLWALEQQAKEAEKSQESGSQR